MMALWLWWSRSLGWWSTLTRHRLCAGVTADPFFSVFYSIGLDVWGIDFSCCLCVPQVTGPPTMFPSTRRSTPWVVMAKCGRSMERNFPMISVPEPRSSAVTRRMSRTWTPWSTSWGLMVCGSVSFCYVYMTHIQLVLHISSTLHFLFFHKFDFSVFPPRWSTFSFTMLEQLKTQYLS